MGGSVAAPGQTGLASASRRKPRLSIVTGKPTASVVVARRIEPPVCGGHPTWKLRKRRTVVLAAMLHKLHHCAHMQRMRLRVTAATSKAAARRLVARLFVHMIAHLDRGEGSLLRPRRRI